MNSWMKRRITRSRARCQKASPERKQKPLTPQPEEKASSQEAPTPRTGSDTAGDK